MWIRAAALTLFLAGVAHAAPIKMDVDATEMPRRLLRAHLVIPAQPGKLVLRYPKWIPGEHGPGGPIDKISKLVITAGKPLAWSRDPVDLFTFTVDVPQGATEVTADLELVLPESGAFSGGATATEFLGLLSWNHVLLYPDTRNTDEVRYKASLRLPKGWKLATALPVAKSAGDRTEFGEVSLTTLVDSPVQAGIYQREWVLADAPKVRLVVAADSEEALAIPDDVIAGYKRLVVEAGVLFGARHYKSYTFLLTLSDRVAHFGLEHHESSDDRVQERIFLDDSTKNGVGGLLSHEYVHSWNGKFRRPAGLQPGRFDVPMQDELLWVYEGLTQYLGIVLAARAGLDNEREELALVAGRLDTATGRTWRPLADTAIDASQLYVGGAGWWSRSRGVDFYPEGAMLWLEIDATIRAKTKGAKSLDDFCHAFHGIKDGAVEVVPYTLDDVVKTLDGVVANDWKGFFDKRVYSVRAKSPMEGLEAAGWKLGYGPAMPDLMKRIEGLEKLLFEPWTLGIILDENQLIGDVVPGSPADRAGLAPNMKVIAVAGRAFNPARMRDAIARTKDRPGIDVIAQHGDVFVTAKLDLKGGPRYPKIEPIKGATDYLSAIFAAHGK